MEAQGPSLGLADCRGKAGAEEGVRGAGRVGQVPPPAAAAAVDLLRSVVRARGGEWLLS